MKVTKLHSYSTVIESEVSRVGDVASFLLLSDLHWDNPHCDRSLLKKHLDEAVSRNAGILIFGDLFCAMQGKYDPRGNKASIRPEHNVTNYLDALVDSAIEYFKPYAKNIKLITPGNHETSILRRLETDITARLCAGLGVEMGTYAGWVIVRMIRNNKPSVSKAISYHHGYGGGGAVTKDIIQASRKAVYLPDADIIVSGHTHDRWIFPIQRVRLNNAGRQHLEEQLHLKLGTYKDEYTEAGGWAVEKGMPPKSSGGIWLEFIYERNPDNVRVRAELA
jgi:UDP-2,3-diacylglucosamine pyrophosphatase LpxH